MKVDKLRKQERLQRAIDSSKAIKELAGNPLLLTMMAILNRNQELPRDRPELYEPSFASTAASMGCGAEIVSRSESRSGNYRL